MNRSTEKQCIDLTNSGTDNVKAEWNFIDLTIEGEEEADEEEEMDQLEEVIRDKLDTNIHLCDIRQVKNRSALLLELWYMATNGQPEQLGNLPTLKDANLVIQNQITVFFGARMYCDLYGNLVDFTLYDKFSGGSGTGKRCVATILSTERHPRLY